MSQELIETANQSTDQRRVEHSGETVLLSSGKTAWEGILLEHIHLPASDISDVTAMSHHLTLQLGTSKTVELKVNGKFSRQQMIPGNICITPVQHLHAIRWQSDMEVLAMTLEPTFVMKAFQESVNPDRVELVMQRSQSDPLIREILLALKVELEAGCPSGRLYGEAMGTALAVHLLKTYTMLKSTPSQYEDGLPQHKLTQVLDYIQAHLDRDLRLADLAAFTGISQYYFCRLFKRSLGVTPHQYVLQQRIERSKQLLKQKDLAIADIALMCGFKNQSHLTTLFGKSTGTTPKSFRTFA
ncbi:AraC family transcriptional regulator [Chroococcidiopsis sp. CCMEE 29]|uniref:AraC family transcriptional regulator n=1 Tax=Chroococcidiopsis sp. CCMEE 29 TaxID=155894 RepID=UPI0020213DF9|nr:AraC family transcriptional regulator [Chroococcidiopsis sp. CCMEE 29]